MIQINQIAAADAAILEAKSSLQSLAAEYAQVGTFYAVCGARI
jgi:hypothetical protein